MTAFVSRQSPNVPAAARIYNAGPVNGVDLSQIASVGAALGGWRFLHCESMIAEFAVAGSNIDEAPATFECYHRFRASNNATYLWVGIEYFANGAAPSIDMSFDGPDSTLGALKLDLGCVFDVDNGALVPRPVEESPEWSIGHFAHTGFAFVDELTQSASPRPLNVTNLAVGDERDINIFFDCVNCRIHSTTVWEMFRQEMPAT